jgi:hypothetical protein
LRNFSNLIGFSGTTFTELEHSIVQTAFKVNEVKFPTMR